MWPEAIQYELGAGPDNADPTGRRHCLKIVTRVGCTKKLSVKLIEPLTSRP